MRPRRRFEVAHLSIGQLEVQGAIACGKIVLRRSRSSECFLIEERTLGLVSANGCLWPKGDHRERFESTNRPFEFAVSNVRYMIAKQLFDCSYQLGS